MSFCRWSSNNFGCDIYAYESDNGFEVHVASRRYNGEVPKTDIGLLIGENKDADKFLEQHRAQSAYLDKCGSTPIGLPFDGESYTLYSPESFYNKMIELRKAGYNFPDYVLEEILSLNEPPQKFEPQEGETK